MPNQKKNNGELEKLSQRLSNVRARETKSSPEKKVFSSANLGWRMILELVIGMLFGVTLGLGLDHVFGTRPVFLIFMSLFGFAGGIRAMMRTAKELDK